MILYGWEWTLADDGETWRREEAEIGRGWGWVRNRTFSLPAAENRFEVALQAHFAEDDHALHDWLHEHGLVAEEGPAGVMIGVPQPWSISPEYRAAGRDLRSAFWDLAERLA